MPERFDLTYIGSDGQKHRPVVIHRAPFGSMERFIGVLIEHTAGNFPLWLAPVQAIVLPITEDVHDYATSVQTALLKAGIRTEIDTRSEKVGRKIRDAEIGKVPCMIVLGQKEKEQGMVSLRRHRQGDAGSFSLEELTKQLQKEITGRT